MTRWSTLTCLGLCMAALAFSSCSEHSAPSGQHGGTSTPHTDAAADDPASVLTKIENEADRSAAIAQAVCPVSEQALGSMGLPVKVSYEGKDYFLCCEGCSEAFKEDPQKFLAKLKH